VINKKSCNSQDFFVKTKTKKFFVFEAPGDQDLGLEDSITDHYVGCIPTGNSSLLLLYTPCPGKKESMVYYA